MKIFFKGLLVAVQSPVNVTYAVVTLVHLQRPLLSALVKQMRCLVLH